MERIIFTGEDGESFEFVVEEETKLNGTNYLLVSDPEGGDECDAYILKEVPGESKDMTSYEMLEDDTELEAVAQLFASLLEDESDIIF